MEAVVQLCLHTPAVPPPANPPPAVTLQDTTVTFRCPPVLLDASFPISEVAFPAEHSVHCQTNATSGSDLIYKTHLSQAGAQFLQARQNMTVYAYGQRATPKRQMMFGGTASGSGGYATKVLLDVVGAYNSSAHGILALSCYSLGTTENLLDLLNLDNAMGLIVDSVKEGPRTVNLERVLVQSVSDIQTAMKTILANYEKVFADVLPEKLKTPEEEALPPYFPDTIVLTLYRYEDQDAYQQYSDANSLFFIALGDSERPALCGIDAAQLNTYEKSQKTLSSIGGVISAIRCNRLRIPFGKSKLSLLLKRNYNSEKTNPYKAHNAPTKSLFITHCFDDLLHAEESYHALSLYRRLCSTMGIAGFGSVTRDLSVDKWRLEQDIFELKDELTIARAVHDYRPCIYDQPKPVQNIHEEEQKRISAIQKRREDAREKALTEIKAKAQEEAKKMIEDMEKKSAMTLQQLEQTLEVRRKENADLQAERAKRIKDYERTLEKIRKRKEEEEQLVEKLREEVRVLEEDLASRQKTIETKKHHLELANLDQTKGREAILREREAIRAQRAKVFAERRQQREEWIAKIRELNSSVLDQVRQLAKERQANGQQGDEPEDETEAAVLQDIQSIDKYLPKLISLDETPADVDATDGIRKQLNEYFVQEREAYSEKIKEEKARKEKLERAVEAYKAKILEAQGAKKREHLQDALKKEQHLHSLVDQVLAYLQQGLRMTKVSSRGNLRRRFFFLSEDCKKLHVTEVDESGMPVNRRKPIVTVFLKDVKRVVIGMYTPSFMSYSSENLLSAARQRAVRDDGTFNAEQTGAITPQTLGRYNYRSFALLLRGGKSMEVVCDSDSDCEAWLVAFRRLFHAKSNFERELERRVCAREGSAAPAFVDTGVDVVWGGTLSIRQMKGAEQLSAEEVILCEENHVPPALFLRCKTELVERSQTSVVTVYDVRLLASLDLVRSQALYEFLIEKRLIPPPNI